jgi:molecular chaperone DnaJ
LCPPFPRRQHIHPHSRFRTMEKDYYAILGIHPKASNEDIRGAYRKRVKELHPDHYGSNSSPFLEVQEAYDVLSNPDHRRDYDQDFYSSPQTLTYDSRFIEPLKPETREAEPLRDPDDPNTIVSSGYSHPSRFHRPIIREVTGSRYKESPTFSSMTADPRHELVLKVVLTPDEARKGGDFMIETPIEMPCPTCLGHGHAYRYECLRCMGAGRVSDTIPMAVEFAPGIADGYRKNISLRKAGARDVSLTLLFQVGNRSD